MGNSVPSRSAGSGGKDRKSARSDPTDQDGTNQLVEELLIRTQERIRQQHRDHLIAIAVEHPKHPSPRRTIDPLPLQLSLGAATTIGKPRSDRVAG